MQQTPGSGLRVGGRATAAGTAVRTKAPRAMLSKARTAAECQALDQLPNVGASIAADLRSIGIAHPRDLVGADPMALYRSLCAAKGKRQDPCVLDTFMAATDFMQGAAPAPWWQYTVRRKALYGQIEALPIAGDSKDTSDGCDAGDTSDRSENNSRSRAVAASCELAAAGTDRAGETRGAAR